MNKLILIIVLFAGITAVCNAADKDKSKGFTGTITMSITVEGDLDPQEKAQMPTEMKVMYSGTKSRKEASSPMGSQVSIADSETKESIALLDIAGNKLAIKTPKEDFEAGMAEFPETKVNVTSETKTIAGYACKKVEITIEESVITAWFTEDIAVDNPNWFDPMFKDVNGVVLEYEMMQGEIKFKYSATEVKKGKLKDFLFTIPPGYQEMTMEELQELMGGE